MEAVQMRFPFAAFVGQERAKQALLLASLHPRLGGVLLLGGTGSGKSTLVRSLPAIWQTMKLVEVPLNITEDRLFGSMDITATLHAGRQVFGPGLLKAADGQVVHIDDAALLRPDILHAIVDAMTQGRQVIEREGFSGTYETAFTVVATLQAGEEALPAAIMDRFGLCAVLEPEDDLLQRQEIVRRVLAYEQNPAPFIKQFARETTALQTKWQAARQRLCSVTASEAMLQLAAQMALQARCAGYRGEWFLLETAKAVAAWEERTYVLPSDLEAAAYWVLPHRSRAPEDATSGNNEASAAETEQNEPPASAEQQADSPEHSAPPDSATADSMAGVAETASKPEDADDAADASGQEAAEQTAAVGTHQSLTLRLDLAQTQQKRSGSGKRSVTRTDLRQGRYVRANIPKGKVTDLAFDATVRAAAPWQCLRARGNGLLTICQEDLRQKVREKRIGHTFLFVVDASGSMGAKERMSAVKGAVCAMLQDVYQKRDQVGMIAFRRQTAEVLLPITRSVDLAQKSLQYLPTGGKTPLAAGLSAALDMVGRMRRREKELEPVLVLVTDGRANSAPKAGEAVAEALAAAQKIRDAHIPSVVIDTERDFIKLGIAPAVAAAMGAACYPLQQLSGEAIVRIARLAER